jgi:hypothetical protein
MILNPNIIDRFVTAYDSMVGIFAYTVSSYAKSLPKSDYFCKSAVQLTPAANQLLATTQQYDKDGKFWSDQTTELLNGLCTSDMPTYDAIQRLGLLPLLQKIQMYRELIRSMKSE